MGEAPVHDIFVVGGGINGCGIARDAAGLKAGKADMAARAAFMDDPGLGPAAAG